MDKDYYEEYQNLFNAEEGYKDVERERKVHKKKHYFLRFLILLFVLGCIYLFLKSSYFAVKEYKVEGNQYYADKEVLGMAKAKTGNNIIFESGISEIEEVLEKEPYFEKVKVKRQLPSTLVIEVQERTQTAAVVYGENFIVISDEGIVLRKADIDPELPLLTGLTISKMNVGEKIECEEKDSLTTTLRMLRIMTEGDIYFKRIDVASVIIHAYIYDSLIVKGTPNEVMSSIESGKLQSVVNNLFSNNITRGTIKMGGEDYMSFTPEIETD